MFKRLLLRLFGKIDILHAAEWIPLLLEGIEVELDRVNDFRKVVLSAVVPNLDMDDDTLDDTIKKYGLSFVNYLPGISNLNKKNFCIEAAALSGYSGKDWLQDQLHRAGFIFYVHPLPPATNPNLIPGELIVGTHPTGGYWAYTSDPDYWPFYFVLSPFPDRIATDAELTPYTTFSFQIVKKLIINLKFQRDWVILQIDYSEYLEGSRWLDGTWYTDGAGTAYP
jgi:hypothetical protein